MSDWVEMLLPGQPVGELLLRGSVTFLVLVALLRIVGQREAGGLGLTDLLVVVLVADAASAGLRGDAESIGDGLVLVGTILFWSVALDAASYRWPRFSRVVKSRSKPLIRDGRLDRHTMRREFMTYEEIVSQLRLHGIEHPSEVHRADLEPNGMVSVVRRADEAADDEAADDGDAGGEVGGEHGDEHGGH